MSSLVDRLLNEANATAVDEGYADIFACIKAEDWKHGEKSGIVRYGRNFECFRDLKDPYDVNSLSGYQLTVRHKASSSDAHLEGLLKVGHAAHLMHENNLGKGIGLNWNELGDVWYKSMSMGLNCASFSSVRRCVVWAAQKMDFMTDEKLAAIKAAFDEVGIKAQKANFATIHGTVTSGDNATLKGVKVTVSEKRLSSDRIVPFVMGQKNTTATGEYSFQLEAGYYHLSFDKEGYNPASSDIKLESSDNVELNVKLTKSNSIRGVVMSSAEKSPLQLVNVKLLAGNSATGTALRSTITGADGSYFFDLKTNQADDYTLLFSMDGYKDAILHVNVDGVVQAPTVYLSANEGIFGTVYISPDRTPLSGVTVKLWQGNDTSDLPLKTATTDSSGKYSFILKESGAGNYAIVFSKSGYKKASYNISVTSGTAVWQNAYLEEEKGEGEEIPIDDEHFPDENFRKYVRSNIDTNNDRILNADEIIDTLQIDVSYGNNISSLEGIEYFVRLQVLSCDLNKLETLDVSRNTALKYLSCNDNKLSALDLTKNIALQYLSCDYNQLTALDLTRNTALQYLYCNGNKLDALDISRNTALQYLSCGDNQLTTFDLTKNTALQHLRCGGNNMVALDVSRNVTLQHLYCNGNKLITLDLTKNTALKELGCGENQITVLDTSKNTALTYLYAAGNQLTGVDVKNNIAIWYLNISNNKLTALDVSQNSELVWLL